MVSQGADMKVYLGGFVKHHETGGVLHQKNTVNLFIHTVVSYTTVSYSIHFAHILFVLARPHCIRNRLRDVIIRKKGFTVSLTRQQY